MAFPVVGFPDAVEVVITYLAANVDDYTPGWAAVPVRKNVPNPRPSRFVRVFRTGGTKANHVTDSAQLTIECWADKDHDAATLAGIVRGLVNSLRGEVVDGVQCYRVDEFSGPGDLPDPVSEQPRMTWTVSVWLRGSTLSAS